MKEATAEMLALEAIQRGDRSFAKAWLVDLSPYELTKLATDAQTLAALCEEIRTAKAQETLPDERT